MTETIKDISVAPTSASVDRNNLCPADGNIVLSYAGGTLGTNATAQWYSDATFTTNVGNGNNLTLATPGATTTYYVRFEGDCDTTTAASVTETIKDISVAPTSASRSQQPLPGRWQHRPELCRRNPWNQCHGTVVLRCCLHHQRWQRQQPDPGYPGSNHNLLCPLRR